MILRYGSRLLFILSCLSGCRDNSDSLPADSVVQTKSEPLPHRVLDVPQDRIFVGGRGVELIDAAAGQAVGGLDWKTQISQLRFTQNGLRAFAGSSSGVFEFDPHKLELRHVFTTAKVVSIRLAPDDDKLFVLEAASQPVKTSPTKTVQRLKVFDLANNSLLGTHQLPKDVIDFVPARSSVHFSIFRFDDGRIALAKDFAVSKLRVLPAIRSRSRLFASMNTSMVYFLESATNSPLIELDEKTGKWKRVFSQEGMEYSDLSLTADGAQLLLVGETQSLILKYPSYDVSRLLKTRLDLSHATFSIDNRRLYFLELDEEQKSHISVLLLDGEKRQGQIPTEKIIGRMIAIQPRSEYAVMQTP